MRIIDSPKNPLVQELRLLHSAKGRAHQGLFLVEGEHLVVEALHYGEVELILLREDFPPLEGFENVRRECFSSRAFGEFSTLETPPGIAARVRIPQQGTSFQESPLLLVLEGVQDPGNVGTLIRSGDAAGFSAVLLGPGCADLYGPKTVRGTQGSLFHLPVIQGELEALLNEWKRLNQGGVILGADGVKGESYLTCAQSAAYALILGNEGSGLSEEARKLCDALIAVPLFGKAESLSVATAGSVLMYALRERLSG
jgi:TrmH family RNA methyltransferase